MFDRLKTAPFRGWRVLTCDESPARCIIVQHQQPNEDDEGTTRRPLSLRIQSTRRRFAMLVALWYQIVVIYRKIGQLQKFGSEKHCLSYGANTDHRHI